MRNLAPLFFALLLVPGCGSKPSSTPVAKIPAAQPWRIDSENPQVETPALLWNGLIGVRFDAFGNAFAAQPSLFAIDEYQSQGEEKIVPLFNPLGISLDQAPAKQVADYRSALDMKTGVFEASYVAPSGWKVQIRTAIHPDKRQVAQAWSLEGSPNSPFSATFSCADTGASREGGPQDAVWPIRPNGRLVRIATRTEGLPKAVWAFSNSSVRLNATTGQDGKFRIERVVSLAAKANPKPEPPLTFDAIAKASTDAWAKRWETDIEIDGPVEDQQAIRSFLFYLRSAIHPEGKMSVSPMALSSDIYHGHVFWDADIWVSPALALVDPDGAAAIAHYRIARIDAAKRYFQAWSKKTAEATMFPWESSVSGQETVPGPSREEHHITGSVAWNVAQANALGLVSPADAQRIAAGAAKFWENRSIVGPGGLREVHDVMSPDEHHTGDNDLYTNLLAMWSTSGGAWPPKPTFKLPQDAKGFLTYDDDRLRSYKQAAAVLSIYPLQYPPAEAQARQLMERFSDKTIKNGPAMTDSIHALIWARLGESERAYEEWRESWHPFVRTPFLLFSEKRSSSRTYFTTGAAGSLQAVLYGFAGLRIDTKKAPSAKWSMPLRNGKILSIAPNLPAAWKKVTLRNLSILGKRYTFEIAGKNVTVKPEK